MSETRQSAIYECLRNSGIGQELAQELADTIDNVIDGKGTKAVLVAIADVQKRLERIERTLEATRAEDRQR